MNSVDDQNEMDIDNATKDVLRQVYEKQPKQQETYVHTLDFIENLKMNTKYPQICNNIARRKAEKFDLQDELFCDVLDRMEVEGDEFLDLEEILEYFTRRGRPRYATDKHNEDDLGFKSKLASAPRLRENNEIFNSQLRDRRELEFQESAKQSMVKESRDLSAKGAKEDIDGYDSDPETHTYSRGIGPGSRKNLSRPKSAMSRSKSLHNTLQKGNSSKGFDVSMTKSQGNFDGSDRDENEYSDEEGDEQFEREEYVDEEGEEMEESDVEHYDIKDQLEIRVGRSRFVAENPRDARAGSAKKQQKHFNDTGRSIEDERGNYKQAMLDYHQSYDGKSKRFALTKPEPYEFDLREKEAKKKLTIRQRKVQEMIDEAKAKEKREYEIRPKPKEVPDHVKKPLYEQIRRDQEKRREEVKANSVAITLQREKPFKFYTRDLDPKTSLQSSKKSKRKTYEERESFVFQANKVPWFCSTNLLEKINQEEELKRQERVAKQAQKTMSISKLPPRMEKHEQERKAKELMEGFSLSVAKPSRTYFIRSLKMFY